MSKQSEEFLFEAEIKEVKGVKTVSLDTEYSIRLITDDSSIMDLGKFPSLTTFEVVIRPVKTR